MSSEKHPGIIDLAVISVLLVLICVAIIAYIVSRCWCRRRYPAASEDRSLDNVTSLERLHHSAFFLPYDHHSCSPNSWIRKM